MMFFSKHLGYDSFSDFGQGYFLPMPSRVFLADFDWWCFSADVSRCYFRMMSSTIFFSQLWSRLFFGRCLLKFFLANVDWWYFWPTPVDDIFGRHRLMLFLVNINLGFILVYVFRGHFLADIGLGSWSTLVMSIFC